MAFDYNKTKSTADSLILKFGQAVTLVFQQNQGGMDRMGDPVPPSPKSNTKGIGVKLDYKQDEIDGTKIIQGDAKLLFSTGGTPKEGMTMTLDGQKWRVMAAPALRPAKVVVMYTLQIRLAE